MRVPAVALLALGTCAHCGKQCFPTRKDARAASKTVGRRMRAYRCDSDPRAWHFGHLPQRLRSEGVVQFDPTHGLRRCEVCGEPSAAVECDACFDREDRAAVRRADR